ncbi:phage tail tube protein [Paraburkholderia bonniea]|nr:phage tail tube protein [Paraburkholderia bonniea]
MTSTAISAQGTAVSMNTGTKEVPVDMPIKNVYEFSGFDGAASDIDVTDLASQAKEYRAGLQDWNTVTMGVNINMKEPSHVALLAAKKSGAIREFTATLSEGTKIGFQGYVKNFPISMAVDAVYKGSIQIRVTGDITVTPAE